MEPINRGYISYKALPYPLPKEYQDQLIVLGNKIIKIKEQKRSSASAFRELLDYEAVLRDTIGIPSLRRVPTPTEKYA